MSFHGRSVPKFAECPAPMLWTEGCMLRLQISPNPDRGSLSVLGVHTSVRRTVADVLENDCEHIWANTTFCASGSNS